ncbi:MAG TPA: cupin domain-containing protein, partial [Candidatus Deferrimicrobium sp.]|nr:cupin domain-containing protein [Candidatus Deferrimicrobium sp.]
VRLLSLNSPQRLEPSAPRRDTFFESAQDLARMDSDAVRPSFGDPTLRLVGHYDGTGPQVESLRVKDPARGRAPAGADTAILAYSGISVKMLVDRTFGADHVTMFTVDYELGGAAQAHDHPFEEAYVFLAGEIEGEMDGQHYTFRPGDVAFAGVGSVHGFYNTGTERVRWIETQAPQPPARHAYRWVDAWRRFEEG